MTNSLFCLSINQALYIENELNKVLFDGVPVGGLFSELIYNSFYFKSFKPSFKNAVKNKIHSLYLKKINIKNEVKQKPHLQDKFIFSYVSNTTRLTDFFKPLLAQFEPNKIVFCSNYKEQNSEWHQYSFLTFQSMSDEDYNQWKKIYKNFKIDFQKTLNSIIKTLGGNFQFKSYFELVSVIQTQRLQYFINCFKHEKPAAILADHDKHSLNSTLILAANKWGIPTYTLVHGSTQPIDFYVPIVANKVLCWGDVQKKQFIEAGTESSRIIVVGNQKLDRQFKVDINQIRLKYSIQNNKKNITILSNPIEHNQKLKFISDILKQSYPNFNILLRIHPSEDQNDYRQIRNDYPSLMCIDYSDQTLEETLACSDIVICHNSVAALETIIKNIPLILYNPPYISFPLGIGEELHKKADVPLIKSNEELKLYLQSGHWLLNDFNLKKEAYIESYIYSFCNEATENICKIIKGYAN